MKYVTQILAAAASLALVAAVVPESQAAPADTGVVKTKPAPKKPSAKTLKCKRTHTAKRVKVKGKFRWTCVRLRKAELPDIELYRQARMLAERGEYEWALDHLNVAANPQDPAILTYIGYANRKAGRLETGMGYYYKALALDPNLVTTRAYLGEAYVLAGKHDLALQQLAEIANRCGTTCEAFTSLNGYIKASANPT
jgi:tetratricopeptide (TPR) repeat protein